MFDLDSGAPEPKNKVLFGESKDITCNASCLCTCKFFTYFSPCSTVKQVNVSHLFEVGPKTFWLI